MVFDAHGRQLVHDGQAQVNVAQPHLKALGRSDLQPDQEREMRVQSGVLQHNDGDAPQKLVDGGREYELQCRPHRSHRAGHANVLLEDALELRLREVKCRLVGLEK